MNHPLFGSRIWKIDKNVTTPDKKHYMRFIEDRPNLLNDLKNLSNCYKLAGRSRSDEFYLLDFSIKQLESGLIIEDDTIKSIESIALTGNPTTLNPELSKLANEMFEISKNPEVPSNLIKDLKNYSRQLSSSGLIFSIRKIKDNIVELSEKTFLDAKKFSEVGEWIPDQLEIKNLLILNKMLYASGPMLQVHVRDFSLAKHYLNKWLKDYSKGKIINFPKRYYTLLESTFKNQLRELSHPSFKPSDLVQRRKKKWRVGNKKDKNSVLLVLSNPEISDYPCNSILVYNCYEPDFGEIKIGFDEIKKVKLKTK